MLRSTSFRSRGTRITCAPPAPDTISRSRVRRRRLAMVVSFLHLEEIRADFRRPIVAAASFLNGSCSVMSILGFNLIAKGALIEFTWTDTAGASMNGTATPFFQDKTYGSRHHMPPLLQEVRAYFPQSTPQAGSWLSVAAITPAGAETYHPLWLQANRC